MDPIIEGLLKDVSALKKIVENLNRPEIAGIDRVALPSGGRLTLTSNTPVLTGSVTGATTIYKTPYKGDRTALYTGSGWLPISFSEISVAVPSTIYRLFDVFEYNNSGTLTLETVNWDQSSAAITAATNATPIVVTSNGHGLSNNDMVGILGVLGNT